MTKEQYEMLALLMRYIFCGMGLAVLVTAFITCRHDAAKARLLRNEAGYIGILLSEGKRSENVFIPREGEAGSGKKCDTVLTGRGVEKRHFYYEIRKSELCIHATGGSVRRAGPARSDDTETEIRLRNGESFLAGETSYMFKLVKPYAEPMSPANRAARSKRR